MSENDDQVLSQSQHDSVRSLLVSGEVDTIRGFEKAMRQDLGLSQRIAKEVSAAMWIRPEQYEAAAALFSPCAVDSLRDYERRLREEVQLSVVQAKRVASVLKRHYVETNERPPGFGTFCDLARAKKTHSLELPRLGESWGPDSTSTLQVTRVRCIVCDKPLLADGTSKAGRRHLHFRICQGACWRYARGFTADLARREGIGGEAAFNRMLLKLLRRNCLEKSKPDDGRAT